MGTPATLTEISYTSLSDVQLIELLPASDEENSAVGEPGCIPKIARYANVPVKNLIYRTGWWFMNYTRGGWNLGPPPTAVFAHPAR